MTTQDTQAAIAEIRELQSRVRHMSDSEYELYKIACCESINVIISALEAAQAENERLEDRYKKLVVRLDDKFGTPCENIQQIQNLEETITRAICQETCAFKGEPACYEVAAELGVAFPPDTCDEPGCASLARSVIAGLKP